MQHGEEHIRQRIVPLAVEREVLAVAEAAAGQDRRQVEAGVRVGVAEVGAVEHHRAVEQRLPLFVRRGERRENHASQSFR